MKLYDTEGAPNPRRVRLFLAEKGIEIPIEQVSIVKGENLSPEYRAINPRCVVPTLVLDDGTAIDEVPAICRYLEDLHPEPSLLGTTPETRAQILSWERHMEFDGIAAAGEVFRNSHKLFSGRGLPGRDGDAQLPELVERGKRSLGVFYDRLEKRLAEVEYVAGENFSLADITGLCAIDFATAIGLGLPEGNANSKRWYESVASRPSVRG